LTTTITRRILFFSFQGGRGGEGRGGEGTEGFPKIILEIPNMWGV